MKCLNCGKAVKQTKGKRAKSYCGPKCRQAHWQKKNKEANPPARKPGRPKKKEKVATEPENKSREIQNMDVTLPGGLGTVQTGDGTIRKVEKIVTRSDGFVTLTIGSKSKEQEIQEVEAEVVSSRVKLPTGFNELLAMAKSGSVDKLSFLKHVENTKMTPGQRGMIIAKLK